MSDLNLNLVPVVPLVHSTNSTGSTNRHRYILDKSSRKFVCPECNRKRFVRFIDIESGNYLPEHYGRCDKGDGHYFLNPYLDGYAKAIREKEQGNLLEFPNNRKPHRKIALPPPRPKPVFFDFDTFKQTLEPERYERNIFLQNLLSRVLFPFEVDEVTKVIQLYRLGTVANGYRAGANTFPFIDKSGNVRAIQVKQFDKTNHTIGTDFLHSIIEKHHAQNNKPLPEWLKAYKNQDKLVSCLFGEHLLTKYPQNPVALVEAPKTAIYGTLYFGLPESPETFIWLAVYNKSSFSFDKLKVLKGRDVFIFPDLSAEGSTFKEWETKAKEYEKQLPGTPLIFSDFLERLAPETDKNKGYDLADYLIKQDWRLFRKRNIREQPQPKPETAEIEVYKKCDPFKKTFFQHFEPLPKVEVFMTERIKNALKEQPDNWEQDITELENYFTNIELPAHPVMLTLYIKITNIPLFIESHLAIVKANNGNRTFLQYLNRLKLLKEYIALI